MATEDQVLKNVQFLWENQIGPRIEALYPRNLTADEIRKLILGEIEMGQRIITEELRTFDEMGYKKQLDIVKEFARSKQAERLSLQNDLIHLGNKNPGLRPHIRKLLSQLR